MKIGPTFKAINRHAAIHECLAVFFAFCWFLHFAASIKMECCKRGLCVINDSTLRAMALIDWVGAHWWLAVAYALLAVASIAVLQIRGRPAWTWWLTAAVYCIPCIVYWSPCAYIAGKLLVGLAIR